MTAILEPPSVFALAKESTPENAATTTHVLELACGWEAGTLPMPGVRTSCTGYDRFVAINHATGPDTVLLMALLDALVADQDGRDGSVQTKHGRFTQGDIRQYGGLLLERNGRPVLVWPSLNHEDRWVYGAERVRT
jgi:hypothetical protein